MAGGITDVNCPAFTDTLGKLPQLPLSRIGRPADIHATEGAPGFENCFRFTAHCLGQFCLEGIDKPRIDAVAQFFVFFHVALGIGIIALEIEGHG